MNEILKIIDLKFGRKSPLAESFNTEINKGSFIILTGINGCGKSTLLKTIAGILNPISGKIQIKGIDISKSGFAQRANLIAYAGTEKLKEEFLTVEDLVRYGLYPFASDIKSELHNEEVEHSLNATGIMHLRKHSLNKISDGEWQKANISRVLIQNTPVILMDETGAFLDYPSKIKMFRDLKSLSVEHGKIVILSTHDIEAASRYGTIFWHIHDGRIESGSKPPSWDTYL